MDSTLLLDVAIGSSAKAKTWSNKKYKWVDMVAKLREPKRTAETQAQYAKMTLEQQHRCKDVGGFVGGFLENGIRRKSSVLYRQVLALDADDVPGNIDFPALVASRLKDCDYVIYSTHSHTIEKPRYRVVIPLSRQVTGVEYEAVAKALITQLGLEMFDKATFDCTRLMFWPSICADAEYVFINNEGTSWLDPDTVLNGKATATETVRQVVEREVQRRQSTGGHMQDPRLKSGIVGAFCRAYDIHNAINYWLPHVYVTVPDRPDRYTYREGSTSGGLAVYDNGLFAYSYHNTDPAGGREWNAFDLVRVHLYGDEPDAGYKSATDKPSYKRMAEAALDDTNVKQQMTRDLIDSFKENKQADDDNDTDAWIQQLDHNKEGKCKSTSANLLLILENDTRLKRTYGRDLFSRRYTLLRDLPWRPKSDDALLWRDADDAQLRNFLAVNYGIQGADRIRDAWTQVAEANAFHPVREYFDSLPEWDEIPRAETVFITWLGAEDSEYTRAASLTWLKGAVARILHPGIKFDCSLILRGEQGIGKSSILAKLGREWFTDSITDINSKDAIEQLQGKWIIEFGEMQANKKAENTTIKGFLTRTVDFFRKSYGRYAESYPRQQVFASTTNDDFYLKDETGGRRFLIIECGNPDCNCYKQMSDDEVAQIWAEVLIKYRDNPELELPEGMVRQVAKQLQAEATEGGEVRGLIQDYLDTLLPDNWDDMCIVARRMWLSQHDNTGTVKRQDVCAYAVWCELYEREMTAMSKMDARNISGALNMLGWKSRGIERKRYPPYGRQRIYYRPKENV